jgi:hypothetical protein
LGGMTIASEEEASSDGYWQEQGRTRNQILTVKIAAARCWGEMSIGCQVGQEAFP